MVRVDQWGSVTHAVCGCTKGKKYKLSRQKGIPCVRTDWLSACLQRGHLVPPDEFLVQPDQGATQGTQATRVPECVDATQAALLPQYVSQGVRRHLRVCCRPTTDVRCACTCDLRALATLPCTCICSTCVGLRMHTDAAHVTQLLQAACTLGHQYKAEKRSSRGSCPTTRAAVACPGQGPR